MKSNRIIVGKIFLALESDSNWVPPSDQIRIGKRKVCPVILGTSPFYSFKQYRENAEVYGERFRDASNIADIIVRSTELGVDCIQTVSMEIVDEPYYSKISYGVPPLVEALEISQERLGRKIPSVSTVINEDSLVTVRELDNVALLIDGNVTDNTQKYGVSYNKKLDLPRLLRLKEAILSEGASAFGFVTHCPGTTIPKLMELGEFWEDVDLLMTPVNPIGYRVRPMWNESCERILMEVKDLGVQILGMKRMASGRIPPREALEYAASTSYLDGVALGVASVEEAEETLSTALEMWGKRSE
jgi:hypothetical protein